MQTLVLIKPDAVRRSLVGEIVRRFENRGLRIAAMKLVRFDADLSRRHYKDHVDKDFYPPLEKFIASGPSLAMVLEGDNVIQVVRQMMGATNHLEAAPGTIRADLALSTRENLVHGSDSPESAEREIPLFFGKDEIL
ncbi:nucleoside-diphosphate kinase [Candidatus Sumerlaeota bacterium]|nr:nucleoside-diphosphate kinase [Candidatus Sumerlaeota bacterium]